MNPIRGAASASDLAFATGRGPEIVSDIEHRRPLVRDGDVAVLASRDADDRERLGCQPLPTELLVVDRDDVRRLGVAQRPARRWGFSRETEDRRTGSGSTSMLTSSTRRSCRRWTTPDRMA